MSRRWNKFQIWVTRILVASSLLVLPLAHVEASPANRMERYTVSGKTIEMALEPPIRFEGSIPILGEFFVSIPPPTFSLSYELKVELDYPTVASQGSSVKYKVSVIKGTIKPAVELAHGVFKMGALSVELPQQTFSTESSFPPGQAATFSLAPGVSVPLTLMVTTHINASTGATLTKESLHWVGLSKQTFEVKLPVGANLGDIINVWLDFTLEPKVGLNLDLKQAGQLVGLPSLPAISGLPSLTWKLAEVTLDVLPLSPRISTSVEVRKAPFPIVPIVIAIGLILVAAIVITVLRRRAKRKVGQQQRSEGIPQSVLKEGRMSEEHITRLSIHDLTERELLILRQEVEDRKKSAAATWLLWLFLGPFGGHRFYQGHIGTGIAMLLTFGGLLIWWIVDIFLIPGMLRANERRVERHVLEEIAAMRQQPPKSQP